MAFPDDYRRVQFAGGIKTDVDVHIGLPGQVIVDKTDWNLRLLDGVTQGGHKIQMEKDLPKSTQLAALIGSSMQIARGTDANPADADQSDKTARLWKAGSLKAFFSKFLAITLNEQNTDYGVALLDGALRSNLRINVPQIADLNTATTTGWARFDPAAVLNKPADYPQDAPAQGLIMTIAQTTNELYQLVYIRDGTQRVWGRHRNAGEWANWGLVAGITQADLDKYLKLTGGNMTGGFTQEKDVAGPWAGIRMRNKGSANTSHALMQFAAKNRDFDSAAHVEFGQFASGNGYITAAGHQFDFRTDGAFTIDGKGTMDSAGNVYFADAMAAKFGVNLEKALLGFESTPQAWALASSLVLSHGLPYTPKHLFIILVCKSAISGYLVGDRVTVAANAFRDENYYGEGYSASADATSVRIHFANNFIGLVTKGGGAAGGAYPANWDVIVVARP